MNAVTSAFAYFARTLNPLRRLDAALAAGAIANARGELEAAARRRDEALRRPFRAAEESLEAAAL